MRILFLSNWHPYPADNGARLRIFHLLNGLSKQHEITLLSFSEEDRFGKKTELLNICKKVSLVSKKDYDSSSPLAIMGFLAPKPRVLVDRYVPEMAELINEEILSGNHDLVIASTIYMADYLDGFSSIPAIFEEVEVGVFTDAVANSGNPVTKLRYQLTLSKLQSYFQKHLPRFACSTVVSQEEKDLLTNLVPDYQKVEVIPNGISLEDFNDVEEDPQLGRIIFTGALTFEPNYKAMEWFINQVYPLVKKEKPEVSLVITGNTGGKRLSQDPSIQFTGYVDDIRPLVASSWMSLAPIFTGGGTRLKILEAFGLRTPVIATSKGAEGLGVQHEKHLLIADTAELFAQETIRLLNDDELRGELTSNAYHLVQERYDWCVILPKFQSLIDELG